MLGLGLGLGVLWNASQNDAILHADAGKDSRECAAALFQSFTMSYHVQYRD